MRPPDFVRRPAVSAAIALGLAAVVVAGLALVAWRLDLFEIRSGTPLSSVAAAFDIPPSFPGYAWTRDGSTVSQFELVTSAGPGHCGWESATYLTIGWPPGTVSSSAAGARLYIRDPHGVVGGSYRDGLVLHATLPPDARPTGHRHGSIAIYVSPSDQDQSIYVVGPGAAERWPRSDPMTLCQ
jgi:hypothetical protein